MATVADADIVAQLASAGLGLTANANLFRGKLKAKGNSVPSQAVFCHLRDWGTPDAYADVTSKEMYYPAVQIFVRSNPGDESGGQALARSIRAAVHDKPPTGYVSCRVKESEPVYLSEEKDGEFLWVMNTYLRLEQ